MADSGWARESNFLSVIMGASAATAGAGLNSDFSPAGQPEPMASPGEGGRFQNHTVAPRTTMANRGPCALVNGKVIQPQPELPILHTTDVLVVGGGPAGVAAAVGARRTGAKVALVERYGHLGGLWTGGLVLRISGHIVKGGKQVCQGIGEEMMRRLEKLDGGIINRRPGVDPTVDAEAIKYLMVEMVEEAEVKVFLHCWGVDAIDNGNDVLGAVFESKAGKPAVLAKVVIDATGDGDIFAAAGAEFEHRTHNIGLVSRVGNLDRIPPPKPAEDQPNPRAAAADSVQGKPPAPNAPDPLRRLGEATPASGVNWVNMRSPEVNGLDVETLTRMEMNHRKFIWRNLQRIRSTPGLEKLYLVETAPQLGVRITRVLLTPKPVSHADMESQTPLPDVIGYGGGTSKAWPIPYCTLVPDKRDQLLASGRCIGAEIRMADVVRLIPNCFVTGHAAGAAAALAIQDGCRPRDVEIAKLQKVLREQQAYLGEPAVG